MYNNNTENTIYTLENPQFKQKLYELQLMMDQYQYSKKKKVLEDAKIVLENYKELNPTLTAINISILELQGKIICSFIFSSNKIQWFQISLPQVQSFIFLKNIDTNKFDANPLYKSAEIQNGLFISFNNFILSAKNCNKNYKIINFMFEIQSALSQNFPFFLKTFPNNLNFNKNHNKLLLVVIIVQQSQFHQQQQQSPYNSYLNIYEKQQSQQLEQSENKQQQEQQEMANKLIQMGSSVFEFGKILFMSQEQNKEKIKTGVKQKVDIELLNQSKNSWNLLNNKNNQMII